MCWKTLLSDIIKDTAVHIHAIIINIPCPPTPMIVCEFMNKIYKADYFVMNLNTDRASDCLKCSKSKLCIVIQRHKDESHNQLNGLMCVHITNKFPTITYRQH